MNRKDGIEIGEKAVDATISEKVRRNMPFGLADYYKYHLTMDEYRNLSKEETKGLLKRYGAIIFVEDDMNVVSATAVANGVDDVLFVSPGDEKGRFTEGCRRWYDE